MPKRPGKSRGDVAHAIVKATLSAIPVVGGPAAELFAFLIDEPVAKRRDDWIEEIGRRLDELHQRLGDEFVERLKQSPGFTTTLLGASQIAVRNHQREKIEALANAVVNTALGTTPDETKRAIMLELIDRLTPAHVAILHLFQAPSQNANVKQRLANMSSGALNHVIDAAYPELRGQRELVAILWRDLERSGLLGEGGFNVMMTGRGMLEKRTTGFGDEFLAFIAEPRP